MAGDRSRDRDRDPEPDPDREDREDREDRDLDPEVRHEDSARTGWSCVAEHPEAHTTEQPDCGGSRAISPDPDAFNSLAWPSGRRARPSTSSPTSSPGREASRRFQRGAGVARGRRWPRERSLELAPQLQQDVAPSLTRCQIHHTVNEAPRDGMGSPYRPPDPCPRRLRAGPVHVESAPRARGSVLGRRRCHRGPAIALERRRPWSPPLGRDGGVDVRVKAYSGRPGHLFEGPGTRRLHPGVVSRGRGRA
jgi:hypothetical protein